MSSKQKAGTEQVRWNDKALMILDGQSRWVKGRANGLGLRLGATVRVKKEETLFVFKVFTDAASMADAHAVIDANRAQFRWDDPDGEVVSANGRLKTAKSFVKKGLAGMVLRGELTDDDAKGPEGYSLMVAALKEAGTVGGFMASAEDKKEEAGATETTETTETTEDEAEAQEHNEEVVASINRPPTNDGEEVAPLPDELAGWLASMIDSHREQTVFIKVHHDAFAGYLRNHVQTAWELHLTHERAQAERDATKAEEDATQAAQDAKVAAKQKADKKAA